MCLPDKPSPPQGMPYSSNPPCSAISPAWPPSILTMTKHYWASLRARQNGKYFTSASLLTFSPKKKSLHSSRGEKTVSEAINLIRLTLCWVARIKTELSRLGLCPMVLTVHSLSTPLHTPSNMSLSVGECSASGNQFATDGFQKTPEDQCKPKPSKARFQELI